MENRPIITLAGRNIPPEIEEKYDKWNEGAYIPLYLKLPGVRGIDGYKIINKNFTTPERILLYHWDNMENRKITALSQDGIAIVRDRQTSFGMAETFFISVYELVRTFKKDAFPANASDDTIVNDSKAIHIEGYEIAPEKSDIYEEWFNKWAYRVYVPLLLEIPGVKACNFFRFVDYKDPRYDNMRFIESKMPLYMSITYLKDGAAVAGFNTSIKFAAFSHALETEFSGCLKTIWNTEYELKSSHRP